MTITRKELGRAISEKTEFSAQESANLVDQLFEILEEAIETGGELVISGRKVVTFKPSDVLRKALNLES